MTTAVATASPQRSTRPDARRAARTRFPARSVVGVVAGDRAATKCGGAAADRTAVRRGQARLSNGCGSSECELVLDWLADQPGLTWQQRWAASGAESAGAGWRTVAAGWLRAHGQGAPWRLAALSSALAVVIGADVIRPSTRWVASGATGQGTLVRAMSSGRDVEGFARLRRALRRRPRHPRPDREGDPVSQRGHPRHQRRRAR